MTDFTAFGGEWRCPKCNDVLHKYKRCLCDLKNPKKIHCEKDYKYFLYSGWLNITWYGEDEEQDEELDIIWNKDLTINPFQHSVVDIHDNYHNLAFARKIYLLHPDWTLFHEEEEGIFKRCYCGDEATYLKDNAWKKKKEKK